MAQDKDNLTVYERKLSEQISDIMIAEEVCFSAFLTALVDEVPDKSQPEYYKVLKKEQMKLRRGSFSVIEVKDMLALLGWTFTLYLKKKCIDITKYDIGERVRFTELMKVCDMLDVHIEFEKLPIEPPKTSKM